MNIKRLLPLLDSIKNYNIQLFKGDLIAGLTVGVMLIPQGMAYAMLAGLPPIYGLYASILPLIVYALMGTSRQLAVGPVAMVSLLIAAGVGSIAEVGGEQFIAFAILLALLVGIIQLLMGIFRLGFLVNFLSHPVISGFTSAAALIIGFSQLKHLLGIDIPRSNYLHEMIGYAFEQIQSTNLYTLGIGLGAIILILLIKRLKLPIPGPLLAVVFGITVVVLGNFSTQGVKIVGAVPDGLPSFQLPVWDWEAIQQLLPIALTISFIGFMESIAVAKAIQAKRKNYKIVPNQELLALGSANIFGAFFQAFPTTGGFSRTAVNDQAGAQTGIASIISALLIALTLLFLTPLFYYLPKAILASVIIVAVFGLIDWKEAIHLWKTDRADFTTLIITFLGTLLLGIEEGILIGVALSLGWIIYRTTKPHYAFLGKIPGKPHYKNLDRFSELEVRSDILIFRFDARLYFANINFFKDTIEEQLEAKKGTIKAFLLDADSINGIDSSALHALEEVVDLCQNLHIKFYLVGAKGPVRDIIYKSGLINKIKKAHCFIRIQHAVDYFDQKDANRYSEYALQTNEEALK